MWGDCILLAPRDLSMLVLPTKAISSPTGRNPRNIGHFFFLVQNGKLLAVVKQKRILDRGMAALVVIAHLA
jgi:hypothetical protein